MELKTFKTSNGYEVYYMPELTYKVKKAVKIALYKGFTTGPDGKPVFDASVLISANEAAMKHLVVKIVKSNGEGKEPTVIEGPEKVLECIDSFRPEDGEALSALIDYVAEVEAEMSKKKETQKS